MSALRQQNILVVEDEPSIRENIVYALETEGFAVAGCGTCGEALARMAGGVFDIVLLDVGLPDGSGFEVCKSIRAASGVPVIFLTARSGELDRVVGLEIGGDDYVVKPFSPRELVARVRAVLRRAPSPTPHAPQANPGAAPSSRSALVVDEDRCQAVYYGAPVALSRYEFRMLKALARHPGRVFSREQLMEHASDEPAAAMERTIDTHIKTLRSRLREVRSDVEPIITHRGLGYALLERWPS